ncbi:MAG: hypothetical protein SF053_10135 [Bacteroidia bacterium]|nr:hypothetical protein [Bacteroidia bacterium]
MRQLVFFCLLCPGLLSAQSSARVSPLLPALATTFPAVRDFALSPDETEAYVSVQGHQGEISALVHLTWQRGQWAKPVVASFSGQYQDLEPFFSPDGLRLYFVSNRPETGTGPAGDYDIWYVSRTRAGAAWGTPVRLPAPVNTDGDEFYPAVTTAGHLYLTRTGPGSLGEDDIFRCEWVGDRFLAPVSLSDSINSAGYEFNAYVAPDESFLIFTGYNRPDGLGSGDLYIAYARPEGGWTTARNLGPAVNSDKMDYCPYVSPRTGVLYFTSKRVSPPAGVPAANTLPALLDVIHRYENGLSRLYQASGWR